MQFSRARRDESIDNPGYSLEISFFGETGKSPAIPKKFAAFVVVKPRNSFLLQNDRKALRWFRDQYFLKMSDDVPPSLSPKF